MGVSQGRSRVADLAFQVFGRTLHPEWFAVREHRRFSQEGWQADVRIIEGGHAVVFQAGGSRLSEVLAGPESVLPDLGLLYHSPIRHDRTTSLTPAGGLVYQTCFDVERVDAEVFAHLCDEMTLDAGRGRLFHRFRPANRMAPAPISHIHVDARVRGLSIQAFHTFPEERAIVRTQSLFEPKVAISSR